MVYPIDMNKPWYHGSPAEMDNLCEGSTITQWKELAEAFSAKPSTLEYYGAFNAIYHLTKRLLKLKRIL
jgi:hypothetical protein